MTVWEMAQAAVRECSLSVTPNKGGKSQAYRDWREELINCCGLEWTRQLLKEAFAARGGKPE